MKEGRAGRESAQLGQTPGNHKLIDRHLGFIIPTKLSDFDPYRWSDTEWRGTSNFLNPSIQIKEDFEDVSQPGTHYPYSLAANMGG